MAEPIITQQVAEKFELLDHFQQETVYEFMDFLLSKNSVKNISKNKTLLLQTSVWTEQDIQYIHLVQEDMKTWPIPTLS